MVNILRQVRQNSEATAMTSTKQSQETNMTNSSLAVGGSQTNLHSPKVSKGHHATDSGSMLTLSGEKKDRSELETNLSPASPTHRNANRKMKLNRMHSRRKQGAKR